MSECPNSYLGNCRGNIALYCRFFAQGNFGFGVVIIMLVGMFGWKGLSADNMHVWDCGNKSHT